MADQLIEKGVPVQDKEKRE
ncbi:hypothetical protein [Okeania sp. SIO2C2]|nr:hypothetical protein [Okeania sp. SIO2C2]